MYVCPHCSSTSISAWRKFNATPWFPARCGACGGESVASGWGRAIAAIGGEVLMWGSIVFALVMRSVYGLLLLPIGMLGLSALVNRLFPLVAIDGGWTRARRRAAWGFGIAIAVAVVLLFVQAIR